MSEIFSRLLHPHEAEAHHRDFYNDEPAGQSEGLRGKPSLAHEVIAGAAAFEAMKSYDNHKRDQGQEVSHGRLKETLAGFAAAEAVRLAEKHHGKQFAEENEESLKKHARAQAHHLADLREDEERAFPDGYRRRVDVEEKESIRTSYDD